MNILENAPQGSAPWHAARAAHYCASEAAAAMGLSKYTTRAELLRLKAGGVAEEVGGAKQRLFDAGHASERAAMQFAEQIVGESLFPAVGTRIVDGLPLLASFDGITMAEDVSWENKLLNASLAAQIDAGDLEPHYWAQIEHQMLVSGASQTLFTASDGTEDGTKHLWYVSAPERRANVLAAWRQFAADLAAYKAPVAAAPPPVGRAPDSLPALRVTVNGAVTASNIAEFKDVALAAIRSVNRELSTDVQFADAEKAVKWCEDIEQRIAASKDHILSQAEDIYAALKSLDDIDAESSTTRLALKKLIASRKAQIRDDIVAKAQAALDAHVAGLNARFGAQWVPRRVGPFAEAIKGLKSLDSIQNAADTALANAKIELSALADRLDVNRKFLATDGGPDWFFLFADFFHVGNAPADVFSAVATQRINKHKDEKAAEAKRILDAAEAAKAQQAAAAPVQPPAATAQMPVVTVTDLRGTTPIADVIHSDPATLGVGGVNIYFGLGITMTAEFIELTLGVKRDGEDAKRKTPTWRGSSLNAIARALAAHALKAVKS